MHSVDTPPLLTKRALVHLAKQNLWDTQYTGNPDKDAHYLFYYAEPADLVQVLEIAQAEGYLSCTVPSLRGMDDEVIEIQEYIAKVSRNERGLLKGVK